jgi:hypothetical protein
MVILFPQVQSYTSAEAALEASDRVRVSDDAAATLSSSRNLERNHRLRSARWCGN